MIPIILILIIIILWICWTIFNRMRVKQFAKFITEEEFKQGSRRAQIIDLREKNDFNAGHILGARNLPYSTMKTFYSNIRKDLPVYLYDQGSNISTRTAIFLHKNGFNDISILKNGYRNWNGKTKKSATY
ncbi:rhodanese-like domain-containing protein [Apilactobacillus xinyiensis]|uniref:Rhodanese-like domain-containing protein n=1 Tax=Apilactobacillus xinyiensis TaxID=2841032 RepID=A0ABT0I0Q1_9LACO|nr:rhodanese-like domain-containing protein [Apilactobacillus xinyiensis]MCK8624194.1 rhodanese-like domain-containing protein [Apilactobacillus xinyiensis]MCL0311786.1 rhodanese-like domain-containing protein [Apilactobacillus xinyiensis]MCL0318412.1 rhodanese-like domain-containing protein [Apilactobacillus xinyiensis]MCL0329472.1 rhodanese-like domain-containing protein [Apilactobacillus xinyiensis]